MEYSHSRSTAGVAAGYVAGYAGLYSFVVLVGPLMERFNLTEAGIGALFGLEMLALAIASVWFAGKGIVLNIRRFSLFGLLAIIAGYLVAMASMQLWQFALARFVIGLGEGLVLGAANSAGATAANSERVFGVAQLAISLATMLLVSTIPQLTVHWDYRAGMCLVLAVVLLTGYFLSFLPEHAVAEKPGIRKSSLTRFPHLPLGILILLAFLLFSLADLSVWLFSERMGDRIGLSPTTIGLLLGVGTGLGLAGPVLAILLHVRYGRIPALQCRTFTSRRFYYRAHPRIQYADLCYLSVTSELYHPVSLSLFPWRPGRNRHIRRMDHPVRTRRIVRPGTRSNHSRGIGRAIRI